jgi:hypothetical protein
MYAQEGCISSFKSILLGELTHKFLRQVMNLLVFLGPESVMTMVHRYEQTLITCLAQLLGA